MLYFLFNWFVKITGFIPALLAFRTKVGYEDRSVQGRNIKGKAIVVSNHNDLMDFAVTMYLFPWRTLRCAVAELMYEKNFFMKAFLTLLGTVRVDRNTHDFSFIEKCRRILDKGGVVEIYPESRLPVKGEETPLPFKPSAVYLALESGAPIIPVYNSGKYFSKERIKVMIGKPIYAEELYKEDLGYTENIENITEILRGKIIELGKQINEAEG